MAKDELGPALPLGTLVPVSEGGVGFPAAVLVVEPEPCQAHSFLQICHPVGRDVDQTCQGTWFEEKKKNKQKNLMSRLKHLKVIVCPTNF